jgi:predicted metal-dependent peptidase
MTAQTTENTKELAKKFANLIGPSDPKLDREVRELLVTARIGLLLRSSFFGNLATRLKLVNADEWLATAATDGRNFYYNSRFVKMLKPKELEFLFGHEVLHVVYDHFGRRGSRDPQLWNVANDYAVNGDLVKHHVGEKITSVPCLYDHKYDNMSSEEIYDHIYENAEKISIDELIERLLDDHLDGEDGDGEGGDGSEKGQGSSKGRPKQLTEEERQQLRDEIKEAVLSAAQAAGAGNLPAGVKRIIQDMTEPKMNWRELLRMQLESTIKTDFTWMRASRKGWHMDAVMPGMKNDDMIDIAVAIDASGSIGDKMLKDFLSEIQGIMDQFQNYKIHIITFDTGVYNPQTYDSDNLDSICDYEVEGGGGTSFECVFEYLKEEQIEPKRLVMFTDGYPFGSWGDENYADTLWILHGTTTIVPPWGQYAYYEEKADK